MPEGDTIHRAARRLGDALTGRTIARFELRRNPLATPLPAPGVTVTGVDARGKHLLVHFDDGTDLHTHMQMTGRWDVYRPGERWRKPGHRARAVIETTDGITAVCFDAPVVELRRNDRPATATRAARALERLGPDLCRPATDIDVVLDRLHDCDPGTAIAEVLLDQRIASGIGNVFASEICWACRVAPTTPLRDVDTATRRALYETAHRFLQANVTTRRRTTFAGGLAVYGRGRRPCPRCRTPIRSGRTGTHARITYWCPTCQPET